ncbi:MAG: hypothetical protein KJ587_16355 [Alphaproteobacteria bacterium]|nr:hypothetical protein [Alphaproteobacteria bacterium]
MLSDDLALLRLLVYAHAEATEQQHQAVADHIREASCALWQEVRKQEIDMKSVAFLANLGIRPGHKGEN